MTLPWTKQPKTINATGRIVRNYFNSAWELWKRESGKMLWDWAVDGPFCADSDCGQRLLPSGDDRKYWRCVRCGRRVRLPIADLLTMRLNVIRWFEEDFR